MMKNMKKKRIKKEKKIKKIKKKTNLYIYIKMVNPLKWD